MRRGYRRARPRVARKSPYEMQQLSWCRATVALDLSNENFHSCQTPVQTFFPLVLPRREAADANAVIPAFARGVTVGGLRFSYNYAITCSQFWTDAQDVGLNDVIDQIDIRSGLVVLPLQGDSTLAPAASAIPTSIFDTSGAEPDQGGTGYFRPRILYRSLNQLWWVGSDGTRRRTVDGVLRNTDFVVQSEGKFSTLADGQEGSHPITVKSKVNLAMDEGLFWVIETNFGFTVGEGQLFEWGYGMNWLGVAAVKQSRGRPS